MKSFAAFHGADSDKLIPLFSVRHCGCHLSSLVEADTREVIKTPEVDHFAWMGTAAVFFRMGGSFLRFVHMLPVYLKQNMPRPVLGKSPAGVAAGAEELKDYAVLNYKSVIDARGDADWSDDSNDGDRDKDDIDDPDAEVREAEKRRRQMRRRTFLYRKS